MTKRLCVLALLLAFAVLLFGCGGDVSFTFLDINLTLPAGYREEAAPESANMLLTDGQSTVTVKRLSIIDAEEQGISGSYSDKQFAEFFLIRSGIDSNIASYGDVPYYSYYESSGAGKLFCISAFYRTPYAYFVITFITPKAREDEGRVEFYGYMDTVYLLEEYL